MKNPPVAANVEAEIVPEVQNIEIAVSKSQSEQTESTEIAVNEKLQNDNVVETKSPITRDEAITEKTGQYTESPELNSNDTEIQQENIKNKLKEIISDIDRVIENESEFPENESKPTDMNGVGNTNGMAPISLEGDHLNGEVEQKVSHLQESCVLFPLQKRGASTNRDSDYEIAIILIQTILHFCKIPKYYSILIIHIIIIVVCFN